MGFDPSVGDTLEVAMGPLTFAEHPAAKGMPHLSQGARGTVYRLQDVKGASWALKIFNARARSEHTGVVAQRLRELANLPGLTAARREVFGLDHPLAMQHRELRWALIMPWVRGFPWNSIIANGVHKNQLHLQPAAAAAICRSLLAVAGGIEARGLAHADISSGNVMFALEGAGVELVDLEEMYGPGWMEPRDKPRGSPGYTHPRMYEDREATLWGACADRYAFSVLLSEVFALSSPELASAASKEGFGYFDDMELKSPRTGRAVAVLSLLNRIDVNLGNLLWKALASDSVERCPSIKEWADVLQPLLAKAPPVVGPALVERRMPHAWDWEMSRLVFARPATGSIVTFEPFQHSAQGTPAPPGDTSLSSADAGVTPLPHESIAIQAPEEAGRHQDCGQIVLRLPTVTLYERALEVRGEMIPIDRVKRCEVMGVNGEHLWAFLSVAGAVIAVGSLVLSVLFSVTFEAAVWLLSLGVMLAAGAALRWYRDSVRRSVILWDHHGGGTRLMIGRRRHVEEFVDLLERRLR